VARSSWRASRPSPDTGFCRNAVILFMSGFLFYSD
jgi:hypothetical protein